MLILDVHVTYGVTKPVIRSCERMDFLPQLAFKYLLFAQFFVMSFLEDNALFFFFFFLRFCPLLENSDVVCPLLKNFLPTLMLTASKSVGGWLLPFVLSAGDVRLVLDDVIPLAVTSWCAGDDVRDDGVLSTVFCELCVSHRAGDTHVSFSEIIQCTGRIIFWAKIRHSRSL